MSQITWGDFSTTRLLSLCALLLSACLLSACAAEPYVSESERREIELSRRLETRGPLLACHEGAPDVPGNERLFATLPGEEDLSFAVLEVRDEAPCTYRLALSASRPGSLGATRAELPLPARQYLGVAGAPLGNRQMLFVVNSFEGEFFPVGEGRYEARNPSDYRITALVFDLRTGEWSAPVELARHDRFAVWQQALEETDEGFAVRFAVDHYHEPLFFSDLRRGDDEGIFEVRLQVEEGAVVASPQHKLSTFRDGPIHELVDLER